MVETRAPLGLLIAALAAAVLAISVFLPWYGLSITQEGATAAQKQLVSAAQAYGNTTFQSEAGNAGERFSELVGRQIATVSAHQALKRDGLILLGLAGIALLASLLRLADARGLLFATGGQIAIAGALAFVIVVFRMVVRPDSAGGGFMALSLSWGAWVALLSSLGIVGGALYAGSLQTHPRNRRKVGPGAATAQTPPRF
jgi:hypothetical protein